MFERPGFPPATGLFGSYTSSPDSSESATPPGRLGAAAWGGQGRHSRRASESAGASALKKQLSERIPRNPYYSREWLYDLGSRWDASPPSRQRPGRPPPPLHPLLGNLKVSGRGPRERPPRLRCAAGGPECPLGARRACSAADDAPDGAADVLRELPGPCEPAEPAAEEIGIRSAALSWKKERRQTAGARLYCAGLICDSDQPRRPGPGAPRRRRVARVSGVSRTPVRVVS